MKPKNLWIAVGVALAAVLLTRETGVIDFEWFRSSSRNESNLKWQATSVPLPISPSRRAEINTWQHSPLPEFPGRELHFSETVEFPCGRWLPLWKFGTTRISRRFSVRVNGGEVLSGESTTQLSYTVFGLMSARSYGRRALEIDRTGFINGVVAQSRNGPANFPRVQTSPVVIRVGK